MDPVQLQMMQQLGMGQVPGIPGMAPLSTGGSELLAATASTYAPPIAGTRTPDLSPLAPLGLQNYGMLGMFANTAGNAYMTNMMQNQGVLPMGNAGSYMQAYRTRDFQEMQQQVGNAVANQDAESFYRTLRGSAALLGMPFDRQQREAARNIANTMAQYSPTLAMAAPGLLDALAGEKGSVQAMAAQMMEANRYRIDPLTGQMGYGADANADMVNQVFETMFAEDNLPRMGGFRAGEMGELYRRLAPEGLVGPRGSLRDRTLRALTQARDEGALKDIGAEAGVAVDGNLAALTNDELQKLRDTSPMRTRMTEADSQQISRGLQDYVGTLKAIREVFGETGNPNAPIPELIGALEGLTSGRMHQFDSARLQTMVRDMQSLSQMSGKSIDQLLAMNKLSADQSKALGLGVYFNSTSTGVGVTTGMAFQEQGGITGFGALSREEAEQSAQSLFNRGQASELANTVFALKRIEDAGGFTPVEGAIDTPEEIAGERLRRIMSAVRSEETTYIDPVTNSRVNVPTKEAEFRSLIGQGGAIGLDVSDFNNYLSDFTSNKRAGAAAPDLQRGIFAQQPAEAQRKMQYRAGLRIAESRPLEEAGITSDQRYAAANAMSKAGVAALMDLARSDPQAIQDPQRRNRAIADALMTEAQNRGIELSEQEALNMAPGVFGAAENESRNYGHESFTAWVQTQGPAVSETRKTRQAQVEARAQLNEAMSRMGPQGGMLQRFFTAVQKQGDRGGEANLQNLMIDMFGADMGKAEELMLPELQAIATERDEINKLSAELDGASPERRAELQEEIRRRTAALEARVQAVLELGRDKLGMGGGEGVFNREDINQVTKAVRNLEHFNRSDQVRLLASQGRVTGDELADAAGTKLTAADAIALGARDREQAVKRLEEFSLKDITALDTALSEDEIQALTSESIEDLPEAARKVYEEAMDRTSGMFSSGDEEQALAEVQSFLREQNSTLKIMPQEVRDRFEEVKAATNGNEQAALKAAKTMWQSSMGTVEDFGSAYGSLVGLDFADLKDDEKKRAIIRDRRSRRRIAPSQDEVSARRETLFRFFKKAKDDLSSEQINEYTKMAEEQLLAENQLRALGMLTGDETLMYRSEDLQDLSGLSTDLKKKLTEVDVADRAGIVSEYLDQRVNEQFYGKTAEEVEANRQRALGQLQTAEGKMAVKDTAANLETIFDLRREFLLDEDAATRLGGGATAVSAIKRSRGAQHELQAMADKYFSGGLEEMLVSGGLAMTDEGLKAAEAEFKDLMGDPERQAEREEIAARLSEAGPAVSADKLTQSNFNAYLSMKARDTYKEVLDANEVLAGAADETKLAETLGVSAEQLDALQTLATAEVGDVSKAAKALGMTEAEYRDVVRGGELPERLKLFKGEDAAKKLKAAQADETGLEGLKIRIAENQAELERSGPDRGLQEGLERMQGRAAQIEERRAERMKEAGLDPTSKEDQQTYSRLLSNQGTVAQLERRRADYTKQREKLSRLGMLEDQIDKALGTMEDLERESQKELEVQRELELKPVDSKLAEAIGLDTSEMSDELKEFKEAMAGGGAGSARTQARVAEVLEQVGELEIGKAGATAFEKLDLLTDEYAAASIDERKKMARQYGMDSKELDRMMRHTEFFGLEDIDLTGMPEEEQRKVFTEGHMRVKGVDVVQQATEEEKREMNIRGTLELTGVFQGEGTLSDTTGRDVR